MIELYDTQLLLLINGSHTPLLDYAFWYITSDWTAVGVFIIVAIYLWFNRGRIGGQGRGRGRESIGTGGTRNYVFFLLSILMMVIISDGIDTYIFKPGVARLRPSHNPQLMDILHLVNNYSGGKYGFYSSHASNSAVLGVMTMAYARSVYMKIFLFCYVFLFGLSRVYLGVHYPLDVLTGWFIGGMLGIVGYKLFINLPIGTKK